MSDFGKKIEQDQTTADADRKLQETETMLQKMSNFVKQKINNEMSTARKIELKRKIVKINKLRKKQPYEELNSGDPSTVCNVEYDRNQTVNSEVLARMEEATKSLGNGSKQSAPLETIEQLSLEESLEKYKSFYQSKEPEDPEERKKRKQEEARIEKEIKFLEDLIDSSIDNEDALNNSIIDPSIQMEGLNVAGSSSAFGENEIDIDEDLKALHNWAK